MSTLVVLDAKAGTIARYEAHRLTHRGDAGRPATFDQDLVDEFRRFPPPQLYVGPRLGPPDSGPSGTPQRAAA